MPSLDDEHPTPVVMKFGGSSVATVDKLRQVAARVVERAKEHPVVVVVSAMGKTTNRLQSAAAELCTTPPPREMDMLLTTGERESMALLCMAIHALGTPAVSLTGSQSGIVTDHRHGRARIVEVRPFRIEDELHAGRVVVVGGFQGVSYKREITTLGRGGSDTSAVALAAALGADCEIYSDVDGIYSSDPREVEGTQRIDALSYEEMQALSRAGAKVLHAQAVQLAQERHIAVYARATAGGSGETVIRANPRQPSGVRAVASQGGIIRIRIDLGADGPAIAGRVAGELGELGLRYLRVDERQVRGILTTADRTDSDAVLDRVDTLPTRVPGIGTVSVERDLAMVSCVGTGLEDRGGILGRALDLLERVSIRPQAVFTETHALGFLVPNGDRDRAQSALHSGLV